MHDVPFGIPLLLPFDEAPKVQAVTFELPEKPPEHELGFVDDHISVAAGLPGQVGSVPDA